MQPAQKWLVEVLTRDQFPVNRMISGRDEVIRAERFAQQFRGGAVGPLIQRGDVRRPLLAAVPAGEPVRDDTDQMAAVELSRLFERRAQLSNQAFPSWIATIHKKMP